MGPVPDMPPEAPPSAILVDMATAVVWTGRPAGTIRRWVAEERIIRYGTARSALFDLHELPEAGSGQGAPERRQAG